VEPPPPPPGKLTGDWDQAVAAERASVAGVDVPERADFDGIMATLAQRDCGPAVSRLNSFAAAHKTSPLADNALYWAGRCYILMGDSTPQRSNDFYNQAIAKFYDLGTTYPEGEKTPAALWEQGQLFLEMGDEPDARIVFSRLIRDYPGSAEAGRARQKLADLQQ
jgi:TolA-binding protein